MLRRLAQPVLGRASSLSSLSSSSSLPFSSSLRLYHERVIDHYENPRNVGSLDPTDSRVGTGLVGAPACGDVMKLQLKVDDKGIITEAKFKTFGCGSAIASSSLATTMAKGKHIEQVLSIKNKDIAKHLNLPPVKLHCSMLAEDAIKAAVKDYQRKQAALKPTQQLPNTEEAAVQTTAADAAKKMTQGQ